MQINSMKIRNAIYALTVIAVCFLFTGCGGENRMPLVLEEVGIRLGKSAEANIGSRAVNVTDPTLTECSDRADAGHVLTIVIDDDPDNTAEYYYNNADGVWHPNPKGVYFPAFGNTSKVTLTLKNGLADPVSAQKDGTQQQLLDADVLVGEIAAQAPVKDLPSVTLTHMHALLEFNFEDALDAGKLSGVIINDSLAAYNSGAGKSLKYLVIIPPGDSEASLSMTYDDRQYDCTIRLPVDGSAFMRNTRYIVSMQLSGGELVSTGVFVKPWEDYGGATASSGPTLFEITGYENQELDMKLEGLDVFAGIIRLDDAGKGALPFIRLADYNVKIEYVRNTSKGHPPIVIDEPLGSTVSLTVDPSTGVVITGP